MFEELRKMKKKKGVIRFAFKRLIDRVQLVPWVWLWRNSLGRRIYSITYLTAAKIAVRTVLHGVPFLVRGPTCDVVHGWSQEFLLGLISGSAQPLLTDGKFVQKFIYWFLGGWNICLLECVGCQLIRETEIFWMSYSITKMVCIFMYCPFLVVIINSNG